MTFDRDRFLGLLEVARNPAEQSRIPESWWASFGRECAEVLPYFMGPPGPAVGESTPAEYVAELSGSLDAIEAQNKRRLQEVIDLQVFLYILTRDTVPFGEVERVVSGHVEVCRSGATLRFDDGAILFGDKDLAAYARKMAERILGRR